MILAQTNPGNSLFTTTVIATMVFGVSTAVATWIGVWRAWKQAKSAKASAAEAKADAEVARGQATFANAARADAVKALEEANRIAEGTRNLQSEIVAVEQKRLGIDYRLSLHFSAEKAKSYLTIRVFNNSPERTLAIKTVGVCYGVPDNAQLMPCVHTPKGEDEWVVEKDREQTIVFRACDVANVLQFGEIAVVNGLFIQFEHADQPRMEQGQEVREFLDLCRALAQWREFNSSRFNEKTGLWDYTGFEPFGPNFKLQM